MKLKLILLILVISQQYIYAQLETGIRFDIGMSKITNPSNENTMKYNLSGQVGSFLNIPLTKWLVLGTEANVNLIQGREIKEDELNVFIVDTMSPIGTGVESVGYIKNTINRYIGYISIPVYLGFGYKKIKLNVGFQASINIFSGGLSKSKGEAYGEPIELENSYDQLNIRKYDYGPKASLTYNIKERFAIEGFYYHGLRGIAAEDSPFEWKIRQLAIGFLLGIPIEKKYD